MGSGAGAEQPAPRLATPAPGGAEAGGKTDDEVTRRALANQEVQRFREVFGGEIRKVRNLKE
jgi:hypothetical protein